MTRNHLLNSTSLSAAPAEASEPRSGIGGNFPPEAEATDANPTSLADDLLHGAEQIGEYIGQPARRAYYLCEKGLIPCGKLGLNVIASKRTLAAYFARLTAGGGAGKPAGSTSDTDTSTSDDAKRPTATRSAKSTDRGSPSRTRPYHRTRRQNHERTERAPEDMR